VLIACVPARRWPWTNTAHGPAGWSLAVAAAFIQQGCLTPTVTPSGLLWRRIQATGDPNSSQCPSIRVGCAQASPALSCLLDVRVNADLLVSGPRDRQYPRTR